MKIKKDSIDRISKLILLFILFESSVYLQYIPLWVFKIKNITAQVDVLL